MPHIRSDRVRSFRRTLLILAPCALMVSSCADPANERIDAEALARLDQPVATSSRETRARTSDTAAVVNGEPVQWDALRPILAEAAGRAALEEIALTMRAERERERRSIEITPETIERERRLLVGAVSTTSELDDEQTDTLIQAVRDRNRLGPARFDALLRRNAVLRAIAAPDVSITQEDIEQAFQIRYGERRAIRVLVTTELAAASDARTRIANGEDFGSVAAQVSVDSSAARGGVVDPMSPADPSWPVTIRQAVARLGPGELSGVLAVDGRYVVAQLERVIPAESDSIEEVREEVEREVRLVRERQVMDRIARRWLRETRVSAMDGSLQRAWDMAERARDGR